MEEMKAVKNSAFEYISVPSTSSNVGQLEKPEPIQQNSLSAKHHNHQHFALPSPMPGQNGICIRPECEEAEDDDKVFSSRCYKQLKIKLLTPSMLTGQGENKAVNHDLLTPQMLIRKFQLPRPKLWTPEMFTDENTDEKRKHNKHLLTPDMLSTDSQEGSRKRIKLSTSEMLSEGFEKLKLEQGSDLSPSFVNSEKNGQLGVQHIDSSRRFLPVKKEVGGSLEHSPTTLQSGDSRGVKTSPIKTADIKELGDYTGNPVSYNQSGDCSDSNLSPLESAARSHDSRTNFRNYFESVCNSSSRMGNTVKENDFTNNTSAAKSKAMNQSMSAIPVHMLDEAIRQGTSLNINPAFSESLEGFSEELMDIFEGDELEEEDNRFDMESCSTLESMDGLSSNPEFVDCYEQDEFP